MNILLASEKKINLIIQLMNILITNISRRLYFVDFLVDIKKNFKNLEIHLADNDRFSPALNLASTKNHIIPKVSDGKKKYLVAIKKIVKKNKINLIVPITNFDLEIFSNSKKEFASLNCMILVSSSKFIKICLDKKKVSLFCLKNKLKTPKIYYNLKKTNINKFYVKKDRFGNTSGGFEKLKKLSSHHFNKKNIVQDLIKGQEFHFDILNDFNGKYVSSCVKRKISMRAGETDKAKIVYEKKLENICVQISNCSNHIGNLDCDVIIDKNNDVYILDLNPRFGGGYAFTHLAGLNYLKFIIYSLSKKKYILPKRPNIIKAAKTLGVKICK